MELSIKKGLKEEFKVSAKNIFIITVNCFLVVFFLFPSFAPSTLHSTDMYHQYSSSSINSKKKHKQAIPQTIPPSTLTEGHV
jgi:hypothetical protein